MLGGASVLTAQRDHEKVKIVKQQCVVFRMGFSHMQQLPVTVLHAHTYEKDTSTDAHDVNLITA